MKTRIHQLFSWMLDYVPVLITLSSAAWAAVMSIRYAIPNEEMLQWILAILVLITLTMITDRFRVLSRLESGLDKIAEKWDQPARAEQIFADQIPNLESRLRRAKSIDINGISLANTTKQYWDIFRECVKGGGRVRLLLLDPHNDAMHSMVYSSHRGHSTDTLRREIKTSIDKIQALHLDLKGSTRFQARLGNFVPAFGIWVIDGDRPDAELWVELYAYRVKPEPIFHLIPSRDGKWFKHFKEQYTKMWLESTVLPFDLTSDPKIKHQEGSDH